MVSTRKELSESSLYCDKKKVTEVIFVPIRVTSATIFNYIHHYDFISAYLGAVRSIRVYNK